MIYDAPVKPRRSRNISLYLKISERCNVSEHHESQLIRQCTLLVLAGGFGTRLRSVVSAVPKPLAPVAGRPYLHYLLQLWIEQGVTRFIFLLHHQAEQIEAFLWRERNILHDVVVDTLTEPQPLGTGGAVAFAVQHFQLEGTFLVANADTWLGTGLRCVAGRVAPAMAVVTVDNAERYGRVRNEDGRVIAFSEKTGGVGCGDINGGLYHLNAIDFASWDGLPFSIEQSMFPKLVAERRLSAVLLDTDFIDIGIPEDYAHFCRWVESGRVGAL
jgi:D-glycero-alpha-D-manno-heptose 1-phosphate guanylyltransferase